MRKINIGGKDYEVVASPITLFFYKKEFGKDIIGELMAFEGMDHDISQFDGLVILQMAWAMIKTAKLGKFVGFYDWISELEFVDYEDEDLSIEVIDMVRLAFFRGGKKTKQEKSADQQ